MIATDLSKALAAAAVLLLPMSSQSLADSGHDKKGPEASAPAGHASGAGAPMGATAGKGATQGAGMPLPGRLSMPNMNPVRGMKLFVSKGCVACHSVNGIGGHDAPALDAHTMPKVMSPFEFAAKLWNSAVTMAPLQEQILGEQIHLTGDELADIVAFVHNDEVQHTFSERSLTPLARKMMDHSHGGSGHHEGHAEDGTGHGHPKMH